MKLSLLPLALGGLTIGITEFVIMGLLPDVASDLHVSIPRAGYLISGYALGVVVGAPLLVIAGRNIAPKKMLVMLAAMLAVFNALSIFAPNFDLLLATRFLSGLPHGAFFGVGAVVASRLADKGREARSIAMMFSGLTIANVVGVPLGTLVGQNLHWRYTFVIIALIGLITVLSMIMLMPVQEKGKDSGMKTQLQIFRDVKVWIIILITAVGFGGLFSWMSYIKPLLTDISGFDAKDVPYILILAGLGMVTGNFLGAKLADKYSPARSVLLLLFVMALTLVGVYTTASNQVLALIMVYVTGCVAFAVAAPIQMLMIRTADGGEMIASASLQASFNIGNALGAFLGGIPLTLGYSFASPNLVGTCLALTGVLLTLVFVVVSRRTAVTATQNTGNKNPSSADGKGISS